ncbi:MAG: class I SAM-dependent methyltransferase [Candidatus Omnitrophica bacterium]|nr:class I SAM-dependent methyltransferase [Candidatus Omnitrophota bacterium]
MKESDIRSREALEIYLKLVQEDCEKYFSDKASFARVPCSACQGVGIHARFTKNGFEYGVCKDCGTLYVRNRPSAEALLKFYAESRSTSYWVNCFFMPFIDARREKIFKPRVEAVAKMFGQDPSWVIGDVGAGFGIFLEELRGVWPKSRFVAIEPSQEQAQICRAKGLAVECCFMEDLEGYKEEFDFLTAFELFEHLLDPSEFITSIRNILKPGGYLYLTTLNGEGFDIQVLWEKAKSVSPPHHLNFFNPGSLKQFLEKNGFEIVLLETPGQLDWDIVEGMVVKENIEAGRFWDLLAKKASGAVKKEFQDWLSRSLLSSHMKVIARKIS